MLILLVFLVLALVLTVLVGACLVAAWALVDGPYQAHVAADWEGRRSPPCPVVAWHSGKGPKITHDTGAPHAQR